MNKPCIHSLPTSETVIASVLTQAQCPLISLSLMKKKPLCSRASANKAMHIASEKQLYKRNGFNCLLAIRTLEGKETYIVVPGLLDVLYWRDGFSFLVRRFGLFGFLDLRLTLGFLLSDFGLLLLALHCCCWCRCWHCSLAFCRRFAIRR